MAKKDDNSTKNLKIASSIHRRLKIHANALGHQMSDLADMYLYEAMRIAERTNSDLLWLQNYVPADHTPPLLTNMLQEPPNPKKRGKKV